MPIPTGPFPRRHLSWWPAAAITAIGAIAIAVFQFTGDANQQQANTRSIVAALVTGALLLGWTLWTPVLPRRVRLGTAGVLAVGAVAFAACFRLHGFTGDLLPVFVPRWAGSAAVAADREGPPGRGAPDLARPAGSADFPQFFGPGRSGRVEGVTLFPDWEARPPEELWRHSVGTAWSGFAVAGAYAVTQEQHGEREATVAYHLTTGEVLWVDRQDAHFRSTVAGDGPRATPTIDGDTVFAQGATGWLTAVDLATGARRWAVQVVEAADAPLPEWGFAPSPLVVGDLVITNPGGDGQSIAAYDRATGELRWGSGSDPAHWSSPRLVRLLGEDQVLMFGANVVGHRLGGGELWRYEWKVGHPHVAMPIALGDDRLFISSGYGTGCHMVGLSRTDDGITARLLWRNVSLKAKFANPIARDGVIYGLDDGKLVALDAATGKRLWRGPRYGHGQLLLVGRHVLLTTEDGAAVLLEPDGEGPNERTRLQVFDGKTWNPPALAGAYLVMRNDREAACYALPLR